MNVLHGPSRFSLHPSPPYSVPQEAGFNRLHQMAFIPCGFHVGLASGKYQQEREKEWEKREVRAFISWVPSLQGCFPQEGHSSRQTALSSQYRLGSSQALGSGKPASSLGVSGAGMRRFPATASSVGSP